jgi:hypothetical protein
VKAQPLEAGKRIHREFGGTPIAILKHELAETANAVSAHLRFGTVRVEHAHSKISRRGGQNQKDAIRADAEMAIAHAAGEIGPVMIANLGGNEHDKVIAEAMHLGETHFTLLASGCFVGTLCLSPS